MAWAAWFESFGQWYRFFVELAWVVEVTDHRADRFTLRANRRCDGRFDSRGTIDRTHSHSRDVSVGILGGSHHDDLTARQRERAGGREPWRPVRRQRVHAGNLHHPIRLANMHADERRRERALRDVDEQFRGVDLCSNRTESHG